MSKKPRAQPKHFGNGGVESEDYRFSHALMKLIHISGGQKKFTRDDFAEEAFGYLDRLEAEGFIERVSDDDSMSRTYCLSER